MDDRIFPINLTDEVDKVGYDCIVFVSENIEFEDKELKFLKAPLQRRKEVDKKLLILMKVKETQNCEIYVHYILYII